MRKNVGMGGKMTEVVFDQTGTFEAYHHAEEWCRDRGISYGSMCSPFPTALIHGDVFIAKWRNLTSRERREVDGTMTGDFRNGPVKIVIREDAV